MPLKFLVRATAVILLVSLFSVGAMVAAACGGDDSSPPQSTSTSGSALLTGVSVEMHYDPG